MAHLLSEPIPFNMSRRQKRQKSNEVGSSTQLVDINEFSSLPDSNSGLFPSKYIKCMSYRSPMNLRLVLLRSTAVHAWILPYREDPDLFNSKLQAACCKSIDDPSKALLEQML